MPRVRCSAVLAVLLMSAASAGALWPPVGPIELVSRAAPGMVADSGGSESFFSSASADGRYVVFTSAAVNLVPGVDRNQGFDVFLFDRAIQEMTLVSHAAGSPAAAGDFESSGGRVSADGRFVVYQSVAGNLVPGQSGGEQMSVFLFDRLSGETTLVSHADGLPATEADAPSLEAAISADGRFVAFLSHAGNLVDGQGAVSSPGRQNVFLYDRIAGTTVLVNHAAGAPTMPADEGIGQIRPLISAEGRFVLFESSATDLVSGGVIDANSGSDLYLYDRVTGDNVLISHAAGQPGVTGNRESFLPAMSADGAFVVFGSAASNLVAGQVDPFATRDVFLWERATDTTTLVSRAAGTAATAGFGGEAGTAAISADGSTIAFDSSQSNLIAGPSDNDGQTDIFVLDRVSGIVTRATGPGAAEGSRAPQISADGRFVFFLSGTDAFVSDRVDGALTLVGQGVASGAIAADGGTVLLGSGASDLAAGVVDTNGASDVFAWDRVLGVTELVSRRAPALPSSTAGGSSATSTFRSSVSADGRFVVFTSDAPNLAAGQEPAGRDVPAPRQVFLRDRTAGTTRLISPASGSATFPSNGDSDAPVITRDGRFVAYVSLATDLVTDLVTGQEDVESTPDVFLYDRLAEVTILVSHTTAGAGVAGGGESPSWSADGSRLVFVSPAPDLVVDQIDVNETVDVFLFDPATETTTLVSRVAGSTATAGSSGSISPVLSSDGRFVAYASSASDLVPGLVDGLLQIFLYDGATGTTSLISAAVGSPGTPADSESIRPAISGNGRFIAFESSASNLIPGGTDGQLNVFLHDRQLGRTVLVSGAAGPAVRSGNGASWSPILNESGRFVVFTSHASDLVAGQRDENLDSDVFVYDRVTRQTELVSRAAAGPRRSGNALSAGPAVSADGRWIAFESEADNLILGGSDVHRWTDVFLHDRLTGATALVSRSAGTARTSGHGMMPAISPDGRCVAWTSGSRDAVALDFNERPDVFLSCRP